MARSVCVFSAPKTSPKNCQKLPFPSHFQLCRLLYTARIHTPVHTTMEAQDAAKAFHEQLAAILAASKASDPPDRLKQLCADGMLALLQLKAAHRSLAERTESFRQDAMDAKTQDGQSSLQLHNIEYEAAQHGKEVKSCKAFTSAYADTDLAMPSAADDEMADADATPHQLELQRLTKELKQRQQLQAQEAALKNTRSSVGDDLESQRAALRRLGQQLNALGSAGKQLASSLEGLEGGASQGLLGGVASVAATAPLLPVPLYVLYSQVGWVLGLRDARVTLHTAAARQTDGYDACNRQLQPRARTAWT